MPVEKNGRIALILAGAFSGLAGGICLLSGTADFSAVSALSLYMGLAGIPVAMMSYGHPLGIMITALAAAGICAGGDSLPAVFPSETGTILLALTLLGNAVFQRKRQ